MTEKELIELIEHFKLSKYRNDMLRFTRNTIFLKPQRVADENEIPLGHTKIGGNPDLPANFQWPNYMHIPLTFMAQFRLSDFVIYDHNYELPTKGMLYFFYETSDQVRGNKEDKNSHHILFLADETVPLIRHVHPKLESIFGCPSIKMLPACKISIENGITVPIYHEALTYIRPLCNKYHDNQYYELIKSTLPYSHHLLGTPDEIYGDLYLECALASIKSEYNSLKEEEYELNTKYDSREEYELHYEGLHEEIKEWQLLFQMATDENNLDIKWGDSGVLFFCIRKEDLRNGYFHNIWVGRRNL